ncbi:MAG: TauD/TfdA family dioxygenase [Proteobacteria bacterium]|nr:TauD/TfdA family dioxygenase [Pseudomonadota bacterium]
MIEIRRASPRIGAEILGADARNLDAAAFGAVYRAFLDHIVIVLRGQRLTEQEFLDFSARFGELKVHITKKAQHPRFPNLMLMDNRVLDTRKGEEEKTAPLLVKIGNVWHTDTSYDYITAKATGMYAVNVPSTGGDTLFSNSYAAYDTLPEDLQRRLAGLSATYIYGGRLKRQQERLEDSERGRPPAVHPLIQTHPETGRKSLYFNDGQIIGIVGLDNAESNALIEDLAQRTASTDGDYRHKWQPGDVVMWDNRCSIHCATGDYPLNERRTNWRATIMEPGWQQQQARMA